MPPRFDGKIHIQRNRREAEQYAQWVCELPSTDDYIHMNLFCDVSKDLHADKGGIGVTFLPWLPGGRTNRRQIHAAWPVTPLYSCDLGELLAVSECLFVATREIQEFADSPSLAGKTVIVRVFNDNMHNLEYLWGSRKALHPGLLVMAEPVLKMIATQSLAIKKLGMDVSLELRWIPGHRHKVQPHISADWLAGQARRLGRSYSTILGGGWGGTQEGPMVRLLKLELADAALRAVEFMPELQSRLPAARSTPHQPPSAASSLSNTQPGTKQKDQAQSPECLAPDSKTPPQTMPTAEAREQQQPPALLPSERTPSIGISEPDTPLPGSPTNPSSSAQPDLTCNKANALPTEASKAPQPTGTSEKGDIAQDAARDTTRVSSTADIASPPEAARERDVSANDAGSDVLGSARSELSTSLLAASPSCPALTDDDDEDLSNPATPEGDAGDEVSADGLDKTEESVSKG
jgi:hypothetical protein